MKRKSALLVMAFIGASALLPGCEKISKSANSGAGSPNAAGSKKSSEPEPDYAKQNADANVKYAGKAMQDEDYDRAERALLAALHQVEGYPGQEGRQAEILNNLAAVYEQKEMYAQCIPLLNKAQKLFIRAYGRKFSGVYITLGNMGRVLGKQQRWQEAAQVYQTAIDLMEETKQTSAPMYKSLLENGFSAWQKAGNAHKAEALGAKLKKLHG